MCADVAQAFWLIIFGFWLGLATVATTAAIVGLSWRRKKFTRYGWVNNRNGDG